MPSLHGARRFDIIVEARRQWPYHRLPRPHRLYAVAPSLAAAGDAGAAAAQACGSPGGAPPLIRAAGPIIRPGRKRAPANTAGARRGAV
ncbi:MAG: hypothetical protein NVS9B10_02670 [Nevskia sp.]